MAHARISMYMPPDIDPTKAAIAYGCRALPKLNEELQSQTLLTRQKALMALCDLMHDPEYVYEAINIGCLENLKKLLRDDDNLVRIKTTEVLYIMATHNVGRVGILEHDVIIALSLLLSDHQTVCRENLHQAYMHLAQLPEGMTNENEHLSAWHHLRLLSARCLWGAGIHSAKYYYIFYPLANLMRSRIT